jgi:hypothetical protein
MRGMMAFELWSSVSSNLLATFETKAEALACVRDVVATQGREYAAGYVLVHEDRRGRSRLVAEGDTLVRKALEAAPSRAARTELTA